LTTTPDEGQKSEGQKTGSENGKDNTKQKSPHRSSSHSLFVSSTLCIDDFDCVLVR
jgi:hypothetical protein